MILEYLRSLLNIKTKEVSDNKKTEPKKPDSNFVNSIHVLNQPAQKMDYFQTKTQDSIEKITKGKLSEPEITAGGRTYYKYENCKQEDLVGKNVQLHKTCAKNFDIMRAAAAKEGVKLHVVSGYRSTETQIGVFAKNFIDKNNPTEEEIKDRMKFSAPPGYSEHSTGFAMDINSTEQDFANTKEFRWLQKNANKYGFEMSYPKDNPQGVGYEPWHWRYVGNEEAQKSLNIKKKTV